MSLSLKKARSILKIGKKDFGEEHAPVYEGDIPDDEKKMVADAEELVEMAVEAKENGQEHPAIEKILFAAEVDGDSESNPDASEEPWKGYKKDKVGEIIRKLPELDEDELADVFEYERENKNRDTLIAALEAMGEDDEEEDEGDYKPWGSYDEDKPKRIISQIMGMQTDSPEFFKNILEYEEENEDRTTIKSVLEEVISELEEAEGESGEETEESGDDEDEEGLTREELDDMDMDELGEVIDVNELTIKVTSKTTVNSLRVKIADELELEYADEDDESEEAEEPESSDEDEEETEASGDDDLNGLDWETLEQLELKELKDVIAEHELGFRAGPKTDLDKLRERIAEALEIEKPAPPPWRGYDKREAKKIIAKLPSLDDDELAAVYAYESQNAARKSVMKKLDELAAERGLGPEDPEEEGEIDGGEEPEEVEATSDDESEEDDDDEPDETSSSEPDHDELISEVTSKVEEEHLAVPPELPKEITEVPFDLTELSDREIRKLYSAYLSYYSRAAYVAKIEKQLSIACKHIADDAFADALAGLDKIDPETGKEKTATQLKAEAEQDKKVRRWRKRERKHQAIKESMRADCDIFSQVLESVSREWTMRSEEIQHSGGLAQRSKKAKRR